MKDRKRRMLKSGRIGWHSQIEAVKRNRIDTLDSCLQKVRPQIISAHPSVSNHWLRYSVAPSVRTRSMCLSGSEGFSNMELQDSVQKWLEQDETKRDLTPTKSLPATMFMKGRIPSNLSPESNSESDSDDNFRLRLEKMIFGPRVLRKTGSVPTYLEQLNYDADESDFCDDNNTGEEHHGLMMKPLLSSTSSSSSKTNRLEKAAGNHPGEDGEAAPCSSVDNPVSHLSPFNYDHYDGFCHDCAFWPKSGLALPMKVERRYWCQFLKRLALPTSIEIFAQGYHVMDWIMKKKEVVFYYPWACEEEFPSTSLEYLLTNDTGKVVDN